MREARMTKKVKYCEAILHGFQHLLGQHENVFAIGQGLWSPWYVGNSMKDLEKEYGKDRVIDTPVSEQGCTGAAIGAALCGYRPIIVHPRMDFMLLATDQIVNQAAKWSHMLGGAGSRPGVTIRAIINRGGEQGAQHSQMLHSWFAHIPGLRLVVPATATDARDLLISSVLCDDPVLYLDDRWLYDEEEELPPISEQCLSSIRPNIVSEGNDITLVGAGYSVSLCKRVAAKLAENNYEAEVIDLRVLNPLNCEEVVESVKKTRRLLVVDGGWGPCGIAGEVIASVSEVLDNVSFTSRRVTLPFAPAPSSKVLEADYYPEVSDILTVAEAQLERVSK